MLSLRVSMQVDGRCATDGRSGNVDLPSIRAAGIWNIPLMTCVCSMAIWANSRLLSCFVSPRVSSMRNMLEAFAWSAHPWGRWKKYSIHVASPLCNFTDMFPQRLSRIDCFFAMCQFHWLPGKQGTWLAETSAVQQTGRKKAWQKSAESRSRNWGRLKSHQDYFDANGILWPGMLPSTFLCRLSLSSWN